MSHWVVLSGVSPQSSGSLSGASPQSSGSLSGVSPQSSGSLSGTGVGCLSAQHANVRPLSHLNNWIALKFVMKKVMMCMKTRTMSNGLS